jgi:hypothetical protein
MSFAKLSPTSGEAVVRTIECFIVQCEIDILLFMDVAAGP